MNRISTVSIFIVGYVFFAICNLFIVPNNVVGKNVLEIFLVILISVVYLSDVSKRECRLAYITAYITRIGLLFFSVYGRSIAMLPFDGKDTEFFYSAVIEKTSHVRYMNDVFCTITVFVSYFLGDARLLYQFLLMMLAMLSIRLTDSIMRELEIEENIRFVCMMLIAVFPTFAMFNVIYCREPVIALLIIVSIYFALIGFKSKTIGNRLLYCFLSFVFGVIGCFFHAACVSTVIGIVIAGFLYDWDKGEMRISKKSVFVGLVLVLILCILYRFLPWKYGSGFQIKDLAERFMFESNLNAGSSYAKYVGDSSTWGRFFLYTPARMFYAMFSPLPWQWRGMLDIVTFFLNSLLYLIVFVIGIINTFKKEYWNYYNKWLVLIALVASVIIGWGSTAFGNSLRHRDKFFLLFVVLLALEIRGKDKKITPSVQKRGM